MTCSNHHRKLFLGTVITVAVASFAMTTAGAATTAAVERGAGPAVADEPHPPAEADRAHGSHHPAANPAHKDRRDSDADKPRAERRRRAVRQLREPAERRPARGQERKHGDRTRRTTSPRPPALMPEIEVALHNLEDLIEFYREHERWDDMERALKKRVELPLKLAEFHMLAAHMGPGAAVAEFYRLIDRPDRAIQFEMRGIESDIERSERELNELGTEARMIDERRERLEHRLGRLHERHEGLARDLQDLHVRREVDANREPEAEAEAITGEIKRLSDEIKDVDKRAGNKNLNRERREALGVRRGRLSEELKGLKGEQRRIQAEVKQRRKQAEQHRRRAMREREASLRRELAHLGDVKRELRDELNHAKSKLEREIQQIETRTNALKKQLERTALNRKGKKSEPASEQEKPRGDKQKERHKGARVQGGDQPEKTGKPDADQKRPRDRKANPRERQKRGTEATDDKPKRPRRRPGREPI